MVLNFIFTDHLLKQGKKMFLPAIYWTLKKIKNKKNTHLLF